jgi:soluble lytic murein transglycosylase-like protein
MASMTAETRRIAFRWVVATGLTLAAWSPAFASASEDPANLSWAAMNAGSAPAAQPAQMARRATARSGAPGAHSGAVAGSPVAQQVAAAAARHGVPTRFAIAVARIESGLRCQARGRAGELGPLQIKPATARGLGYSGPASALNSCGAGLEWGMRHLAAAYRRCGSDAGAAALHNRGLASSCTRTAYSTRVSRAMASL